MELIPAIYYGQATCTGRLLNYDFFTLPKQPKEFRMYVYDLILVNKDTDEVLRREVAIGENEGDAMAVLELNLDEKKLRKKRKLAVIIKHIGDYKPLEVKEVRITKDE